MGGTGKLQRQLGWTWKDEENLSRDLSGKNSPGSVGCKASLVRTHLSFPRKGVVLPSSNVDKLDRVV